MEAYKVVETLGGQVVAFSALANRGFCKREGGVSETKKECKTTKRYTTIFTGQILSLICTPQVSVQCVKRA